LPLPLKAKKLLNRPSFHPEKAVWCEMYGFLFLRLASRELRTGNRKLPTAQKHHHCGEKHRKRPRQSSIDIARLTLEHPPLTP
jgi:hypothetical protein